MLKEKNSLVLIIKPSKVLRKFPILLDNAKRAENIRIEKVEIRSFSLIDYLFQNISFAHETFSKVPHLGSSNKRLTILFSKHEHLVNIQILYDTLTVAIYIWICDKNKIKKLKTFFYFVVLQYSIQKENPEI